MSMMMCERCGKDVDTDWKEMYECMKCKKLCCEACVDFVDREDNSDSDAVCLVCKEGECEGI